MDEIVNIAGATRAWLFAAMPRGRIAVLRTAIYLFVVLDVVYMRAWVADHGTVPASLWHPLMFERVLYLPVPTPGFVTVVKVMLVVAALAAASGRWPRFAGTAVFLLYLEWQFIAFSYGKVDHDRCALLVALAVLPTAGLARWGDKERSQAAGWALRLIMIAVVAVYFMSVIAKIRYGGLDWVSSATAMRAVLRRGTMFSDPFRNLPWVFVFFQYVTFAFELGSPLMLARGRIGRTYALIALGFHTMNLFAIGIMFWPQVVCLGAFFRLERLHLPAGLAWLSPRARPAEVEPARLSRGVRAG